jgi:hypothetical protein
VSGINRPECPNCGSYELKWDVSMAATRNLPPGSVHQLSLGDTSCIFFLGCEECSETVRTVTAEDVAMELNVQRIVIPEGS